MTQYKCTVTDCNDTSSSKGGVVGHALSKHGVRLTDKKDEIEQVEEEESDESQVVDDPFGEQKPRR